MSFEPWHFPGGLTPDTLRTFFVWCARQSVSDIHIQGGNHIVVGRYGKLEKASPFVIAEDTLSKLTDAIFNPELRSMVRGGNGVDRALQLDGDMNNRYGLARGERIRFRCNFTQGTAGREDVTMALTMRVIPSDIPPLSSLHIEDALRDALLPHKGLGLVCGETGSGKSTLLASTYRHCCDTWPDRKIITAEDPVEYVIGRPGDLLPPVQSQVGRDVSSFAEALRLALRRAPRIIGVGEIRDLATLSAAVACAQSGHLCLSTMHTHSVGETIPRALLLFPTEVREAAARDLLGVMQYIVIQQLLRTTDGTGHTSNISLIDSTGAPWPVELEPINSAEDAFDVRWVPGLPVISVQALRPYLRSQPCPNAWFMHLSLLLLPLHGIPSPATCPITAIYAPLSV